MKEERRVGHDDILVKLTELKTGQEYIKKSLKRIEAKTVSNSTRIGNVEGKVKWMMGFGGGSAVVIGIISQIRGWWR